MPIWLALAITATNSAAQATPVTVPITLDHNRIIVDAEIAIADGPPKRVRVWVDTGNSDFLMSQSLASALGLNLTCDGEFCAGETVSSKHSLQVVVGGMRIPLSAVKEAKVPIGVPGVAPGLAADINLPSTILRNYDVLVNFPGRELTIAQPGSLHFSGVKAKVAVNAESGLIEVPSQIENKKYSFGLDLGSPISFLTVELFDKLAAAHADWPNMTGAIGPANISGDLEEARVKLMRIARLHYGPLFLTDVAVAELPKSRTELFERRAGIASAGFLGTDALINYRVGLDYTHATVYFEIGRTFKFPAFDVIGLTLRPEADGSFTIVGQADYQGKASVTEVHQGDRLLAVDGIATAGSTFGQVWLMLGGEAEKERTLTVERGGNQLKIPARVQHFLGETSGNTQESSRKK